MTAPRKVLLLGATGFIGSRLRAALEAAELEVICGARAGHAPCA